MDHAISIQRLRRIARSFDIQEDPERGKGSHTWFFKRTTSGTIGYTIPTNRNPVKLPYIREFRKKFSLTVADGITDQDFYSRG